MASEISSSLPQESYANSNAIGHSVTYSHPDAHGYAYPNSVAHAKSNHNSYTFAHPGPG